MHQPPFLFFISWLSFPLRRFTLFAFASLPLGFSWIFLSFVFSFRETIEKFSIFKPINRFVRVNIGTCVTISSLSSIKRSGVVSSLRPKFFITTTPSHTHTHPPPFPREHAVNRVVCVELTKRLLFLAPPSYYFLACCWKGSVVGAQTMGKMCGWPRFPILSSLLTSSN